jgi:hypothetical protein
MGFKGVDWVKMAHDTFCSYEFMSKVMKFRVQKITEFLGQLAHYQLLSEDTEIHLASLLVK